MNEFVLNGVVKRRAELVDNIERTHEAAANNPFTCRETG